MFCISATINFAGPGYAELDIQGPFTQSQYEEYIRLTLAAYPEASSFEFILIPAQAVEAEPISNHGEEERPLEPKPY